MHIATALENIDKLTVAQLKHAIQLCQDEIDNYKIVMATYSEEYLEKYGRPYLHRLEAKQQKFVARLK